MCGHMIIACLPVDKSCLPQLPPEIALPVPTHLYSITQCDQCGRDVWIGPRQKRARIVLEASALCYLCVIPIYTPTTPLVDLGGGAGREGIRRT